MIRKLRLKVNRFEDKVLDIIDVFDRKYVNYCLGFLGSLILFFAMLPFITLLEFTQWLLKKLERKD